MGEFVKATFVHARLLRHKLSYRHTLSLKRHTSSESADIRQR